MTKLGRGRLCMLAIGAVIIVAVTPVPSAIGGEEPPGETEGCMKCFTNIEIVGTDTTVEHDFDGQETCTGTIGGTVRCTTCTVDDPCHPATVEGTWCEQKHDACGENFASNEENLRAIVDAAATGDAKTLHRFATAVPGLRYNAARNALQVLDCDGHVVLHLAIAGAAAGRTTVEATGHGDEVNGLP